MAIERISNIRMYGSASVPTFTGGIEDASESWKEGGVLVAHSDGEVAEAGNGAITEILGIAVNDATTTTGSPADYIMALPGLVFEITLDNQNSSPLTSLQTHLYGYFGIYQEAASGFFYVDINTTNTVRILRFVDPVGTVQARVLATFLNQATIFDLPAL